MKFPLFFRISPQNKAKRIYFESLKQASRNIRNMFKI